MATIAAVGSGSRTLLVGTAVRTGAVPPVTMQAVGVGLSPSGGGETAPTVPATGQTYPRG